MATVKDLTAALAIGKQQGKQEALVAKQEGGNRFEDMTGYGKNWPGTMKDQGLGDEPGKDPAEMIQLELPLDLVNKLKIMADENPEIAQGIADELMIAGNPSFDINETPATRRIRKIRTLQERGIGGEKGNAGDILKKGVQLPNLQASGPDYIGDKLRYGQLDRILNPLGDFRKPTLDQLRIHSQAYPKQASLPLGDGRSLGAPEIKFLREIFPGASEKEKNRLIKMYGTGWMKAESPANNIRKTWPWRTRQKEGTGYREFYDPLTGMSRDDFKA